ncbi:MAG: hypothetical protein A3H72_01210 [Candidatus Doudnabacteria bacterium RIFCSPLOWO2_02_FULL_48_8]|uniref:Uncharacterized protein n=1 Tax=Candidatus Doudnabacteria bacterium RIFCSPHIGHO2_01_FULL_46_24 TaxID=1817825 RepID=A0A1F5NUU0_9BACT|nr:MAG: hypothetical protein A2720_02760 [Candidatus Doudnabacteria bacterium RIFCSPHIGHO2_01_FULL_46_24]OGE95016.1 MAG: hypothetical protein A3H72_01210 [Candidatus Doudnabacteria bacterium RIFCSPLOWO2_02_FULL_48_8]OGE95944.1 MAG: hypothetical protein A3E98_00655 [Candidatus Doudnabacteria bacterium RIFCSPHIGHO2_12_FULL_48_11]
MYIKKRMRSKLILLVLFALAFLYWRGTKAIANEKNLECEWHLVYAICKQKGKATELPSIFDVLKAGAKF